VAKTPDNKTPAPGVVLDVATALPPPHLVPPVDMAAQFASLEKKLESLNTTPSLNAIVGAMSKEEKEVAASVLDMTGHIDAANALRGEPPVEGWTKPVIKVWRSGVTVGGAVKVAGAVAVLGVVYETVIAPRFDLPQMFPGSKPTVRK
jgi:hypothetical protein